MGRRVPERNGPRGRGALSSPASRYAAQRSQPFDDGWQQDPLPPLRTTVTPDASRTVIARNDSPDIPFDRSINPYRGCEHGCVYCYARPGHAWLGLSPGLDFETRLYAKRDAAALLHRELSVRGYRCAPIALGSVTDAYQPVERSHAITRSILEVLRASRHPVTLVTKSALVERDIDLLADLAADGLVQVRLSARLREAGVPVGVMVAPLIPFLTDGELEAVLAAAHEAGAIEADYVLLRLPLEVAGLFREWLAEHAPLQAERVMARVRDTRGGLENDPRFGHRMTGEGVFADVIAQRFRLACGRLGFRELPPLRTDLFRPPAGRDDGQLALF